MNSWDNFAEAVLRVRDKNLPAWDGYLGFYSSWFGGYFREPWAMQVPIDDHGFHRGDGVFEAVRLWSGAYFDLPSHLERLEQSAAAIGMKLPETRAHIAEICVELARRCQAPNAILRLYVTRGPGGFSPSPAEVVGHQIYAVLTKFKPASPAFYEHGCRTMISTVTAKEPFWSHIKSCNYLQNVLMKQECNAKGFDFAICADGEGRLCEGSTENFFLVDCTGQLVVPRFDYTLRGTTMRIVMRLAEQAGVRVSFGDVHRGDLAQAREAAFVGTTLGVLPIKEVEGQQIGDGKPGPLSKRLNDLLLAAMVNSKDFRTVI